MPTALASAASRAVAPRPGTLFAIAADLLALNELLDEIGGDVSDPTAEKALDAWYASLAEAESVKLSGYVGLIHLLNMEAEAAEQHAAAYAAKARTRKNRVAWLKARLKDYLTATGRTKAATSDGQTVAVQQNGGVEPLHVDDGLDLERVDAAYVRHVPSLNVDAVRAALKAGQSLPFARLEPRGTHLRIR